MKKYFFTTLLLAITAFTCLAQEEGRMSIGVDAGIPLGASAEDFASIIGGSLKAENPIGDANLITISIGYSSLSAKSMLLGANIKPPATIFTPLKIGLKHRLAGPLFIEAQTGAAFEIRGRRSTRFVYAPGLVCNINKFDLGVRYEGWVGSGGTISQVAARLGFSW
nr:hypothetical protein [uncultured Mucilaginibacter sp.]